MNGKVMLLIDADNVSADVISQAVEKVLAEQGAIHVRRAYCTAESAQKNLALFKRHSIRPIVNLSAGKNSTDIALAVDALDLVLAERPQLVVIVSSDSDFAPLVAYERLGQDARLAIPTPDHYLPLLYVLGTRQQADAISFPVEGTEGGSISMLAVQVG